MHPAFGPGVRVFGLRPISRWLRGRRNREIGSSGNRVIGLEMNRVGFANLGPSLPATPLVQDDRLRRGEFPPRQANTGLVGDPGFTPRSFVWVWDWVWATLGWPLGGPSVAQAWPKGHASVEWKKCLCL